MKFRQRSVYAAKKYYMFWRTSTDESWVLLVVWISSQTRRHVARAHYVHQALLLPFTRRKQKTCRSAGYGYPRFRLIRSTFAWSIAISYLGWVLCTFIWKSRCPHVVRIDVYLIFQKPSFLAHYSARIIRIYRSLAFIRCALCYPFSLFRAPFLVKCICFADARFPAKCPAI